MRSAVWRWLRGHWLLALAIVSLSALVIAVNPVRIAHLFEAANRTALVLMAPCVISVYLFKGIGWWLALRRIGLQISLRRALYVMLVGRTLVFIPTGDLARIALLRESVPDGPNAGEIAATIAFQELLYMLLVGLSVLPKIGGHPELIALVVLMAAAHAGIFAILLWRRLYAWAVGVVDRVRFLRRFDPQLRSLRPAFLKMTTPGLVAQMLLWNGFAVLSLLALFNLAITAVVGAPVAFVQTTFAYGLGHLLGGLSFLPSGMGAMEAIVAGLLVTQGIPFDRGVAGVLLFRSYNDLLSAGAGALLAVAGRAVMRRARRVQAFSNS